MKRIITLLSLLFIVFSAQSQMMYLKGVLQGSQQVPANASTATGVVIVKYDTINNMLTLFGNYKGLTSVITMSHIHGPAAAGANAAVLFPLENSGDTTGTLSGTASLSQEQETELLGGLMYVNVHNANYPNGEIRAQLSVSSSADYYDARLQGAQQVPPNGSTAMGMVHVLVDKGTDSVFLTGSFHGLTAPAMMAHIHKNGLPGVNGPIFQYLIVSKDTTGIFQVADTISADNIKQMSEGLTYVNVHDSVYPDGEIRGQLTMLNSAYFFKATLRGSQQVPPVSSTAMGTVIVKYDPSTKILKLVGDYQGITDTVTGSHIHGPAPAGSNAPILIPLNNTGGTTGVLSGTDTLTAEQETDMLNGLMYVNVHNNIYPNGEIRGQLTPVYGEGHYFTGDLQGAQQVPPNASTATGNVTVLLDKTFDSVWVTGDFSGLTGGPAEMGHIHRGQAGTNGPVIVPLSVSNNTYGTITGTASITSTFADSMVMGYSYVNIHNQVYPGGEIRAQLGSLVLPVKLVYFNGYKQGNNISLIWQTAQEINLQKFEAEQQDAITGNWIKKATIVATDNNMGAKYSLTDVPTTGKNGVVLYRLKIINSDGSFSYSPVISILLSGSSNLIVSIVPNPVVNGVLVYTITGLSTEQKANVKIVDFNGRTVASATVSTLQNNRFNINNLQSGLYKLVVNVYGTQLNKTFSKQ